MASARKLSTGMFDGAIPTIAAAEATSFSPSTSFTVLAGYHEPGDGGGGMYVPSPNQASPSVLRFQDLNDVYWDLRENEILYEMAGAKGDGTTDDAVAMQKAHDTGKVIRIGDRKQYVCSETITIEQGGAVGSGKTSSVVKPNFNGTLYSVMTNDPVMFRDFAVNGGVQRTSGAAILVDAPVENTHSVFEGLFILQANCGIDFVRAAHWALSKSTFGATTEACVKVRNLAGADSGDSSIMQCSMLGSYSTNVGILQNSSGGLKVIGNKILGVHNIGYRLLLTEGAITSILLIEGNSIENCTDSCIDLEANVTAGSYNMVRVAGNELAGSAYGVKQIGDNLGNLQIEGNLIAVGTGGALAQGVSIEAAQGFTVKNNTFINGGGTILCVGIGSGAARGEVGGNRYDQIAAGAGLRVSNASGSTTVTDTI